MSILLQLLVLIIIPVVGTRICTVDAIVTTVDFSLTVSTLDAVHFIFQTLGFLRSWDQDWRVILRILLSVNAGNVKRKYKTNVWIEYSKKE